MTKQPMENPAAVLEMIAPQFLTSKCDRAMAKSTGLGRTGM
ncbi:hypothetical protein [Roseibium sp.]|nr:hypothetical protein [Roseibium sp.]